MPRRRKFSGSSPEGNSALYRQLAIETEVHLRRMRITDALIKLEAYIADATAVGLKRVRVVHGKGTGRMKNAVQSCLSRHKMVVKYYPATPAEGDGGVTIVELK